MPGQVREQEPLLPRRLPLTAPARLALVGVVLALLTALVRAPFRHPDGGHFHVALAQELMLSAGAALLCALAWRARLATRADRITLWIGLLLLLELLSAALAPNGHLALRASTLVFAGCALLLIARHAPPGSAQALAVPAGVVAASVVLEALGVLPGLSPPGHAPGGVLGQRNLAAQFIVCGAPFVALLAVRAPVRWQRGAGHALAALSIAAVVLTRSRSAWLAVIVLLALGVTLVSTLADNEGRGRAALLAITIAIGAGVAPRLPTTLAWSSATPFRDTASHLVDASTGSGAGRMAQYGTTLRMALAHPMLGVGPGGWSGQYPRFAAANDPSLRAGLRPTNRLPSSDLLGAVAERGFIALVLGLLLLVELWRAPGAERWTRRALLIALAVVASLDAVLQTAAPLALVALGLGFTTPAADEPPAGTLLPRATFATAALILLVFAGFSGLRLAALHALSGRQTFAAFELAVRRDPGDVASRMTLAEALVKAGRCAEARSHLASLQKHSPAHPWLGELIGRCASQ